MLPLFVCPGEGVRREVASMPGVFNTSIDELLKDAREAQALGIGGVILFGIPSAKDERGSEACAESGIVQQALRARQAGGARSCSPSPTSVSANTLRTAIAAWSRQARRNFEVNNDETLELLAQSAVSFAEAGADIVAPSDMMDGRVAAIRDALDDAGHENTPILAYAAKFASAFYGPFREAADSAPQFGDRRGYQMDGANLREALREIELDIEEGADMIMVKPAMPYLDVIAAARATFELPLSAYQVSGEYAMIHAAARNGWIDLERAMMESLISHPPRRRGDDPHLFRA